jgi:CHAD domain-containing protein
MLGMRSPTTILTSQLEILLGHVPGIRDGDENAIHDARVATRRVREALELGKPGFRKDDFTEIYEAVRTAGRALGAARDADVLHNLLLRLDTRLPLATAATAQLRSALLDERRQNRRRLVKRLERLSLGVLKERIARARPSERLRDVVAPEWRQELRRHVGRRSKAVREALHHAGGIYFPNRSHSVRIAIKKLRYALELADALGPWHPVRAVRRLKRAQDALGDAHDRQTAIARLEALDPRQPGIRHSDVEATVRLLEAEIQDLYKKYADQRKELIAICRAGDRFAAPRRVGRTLMAAGLVVPPLIALGRRAAATGSSSRDERAEDHSQVRIEIPIP